MQKGDDVAIGDEVSYKITATIPEYSAEYNTDTSKVEYIIHDTLDGLSIKAGTVEVKIDGTAVAENEDKFTVTAQGQNLQIAFKKGYILLMAEKL